MTEVSWTQPGFDPIARMVSTRIGLSFKDFNRESTEAAILRGMRATDVNRLDDYHRLLLHNAEAMDRLIVELTVGETYFFREPAQFEQLRTRVLPEIYGRMGSQHMARVWSAGCASGEEPYSLAILFRQQGRAEQVRILATDISSKALGRAREATYGRWSFRGTDAQLQRYFDPIADDVVRLKPAIQEMVRFESLNLATDVYPSVVGGTRSLDLIFCRNVLIYFDRETIAAIAERFYQSLAVGGWLVTASSDPPLDRYAPLEPVMTEAGILYRRGPLPGGDRSSTRNVAADRPAATRRSHTSPPARTAKTQRSASGAPSAAGAPSPATAQPPAGSATAVAAAHGALNAGRYQEAARRGRELDNEEGTVLEVKALANLDVGDATACCREATRRFPLSIELHYLLAVLHSERGEPKLAAESLRRVLYLDRSLPLAHFALGSAQRQIGLGDAALRSFRNVINLCSRMAADDPVSLGDGETVGGLAHAAEAQIHALHSALGHSP